MKPVKRILVLSSGAPAGVNFMRSLWISGRVDMYAGDCNKYHLAYPRGMARKCLLMPRVNTDLYIDTINQYISAYDIDFVHAQSDPEVLAISENREKIHAKTFLPSKETVRICQDKSLSAEKWDLEFVKLDPLSPTSYQLQQAFKKFGGKVWIRATKGAGGKASCLGDNLITSAHWIAYWQSRDKDIEFEIRRYLSGRNLAWQSVWKDGELLTSQARERVEYIYPNLAPSGITGTPTVQRTVNEDKIDEAAEYAVKMIDDKPNGIFCVDLKEDSDGVPFPTEINAGRFFTTSYFFSYVGKEMGIYEANMPRVYLDAAFDELEEIKKNKQILPKGLYWLRHIDIPAQLLEEEDL